MSAGTWYVKTGRTAVNWGTDVSGGVAQVDITKLVVGTVNEQRFLFARAGQAVTAAQVTAAQAETTSGSVPAALIPSNGVAPGGKNTYVQRAAGSSSTAAPLPFVNVRDFGAIGDGSTDDTAAINAAIATLTPGATLYLPGLHRVTAQLNQVAADSVTIRGPRRAYDGNGRAGFRVSTGVPVLSINANACRIEDLYFLGLNDEVNVLAGAATAISFESGDYHIVERCRFTFFHKGVWFKNSAFWTLRSNTFTNCTGYPLHIQNVATPDAGDSWLVDNNFAGGTTKGGYSAAYTSAALVHQESGGGVKVIGNKFFGGTVGYEVQIADGANTSILPVTGNSFEHQNYAAIRLLGSGVTNTGTFKRIPIVGNQFTCEVATQGCFVIESGASNMFSDVLFNSNVCTGSASTRFIFADFVTGLTVVGNRFNIGTTAVQVGGNSSDIYHRNNHLTSISGPRFRWDNNTSTSRLYPAEAEKTAGYTVTSTSTYTTVATVNFNNTGSCLVDVNVQGLLTGGTAGPVSGRYSRLVSCIFGSVPVVATVGTDATGPIAFDILFDVSAANVCTVKIRRNAADGGTSIAGSVTTKVTGQFQILQ